MNNFLILIIALIVIIFTGLMIFVVVPWLKRKDVDIKAALDKAANVAATATKALEALKPFIKDAVDVNILDKVMAAAHVGVGNAQQLYYVGGLKGDERNAAAQAYIADTLKLANIEITPELQRIINGAVESEVFALGHGTKAE